MNSFPPTIQTKKLQDSIPPHFLPPDCTLEVWHRSVLAMWTRARRYDWSIPDTVLDRMRDVLLGRVSLEPAPVAAWPAELTPELRQVLGMMNYTTVPMAHAFRDCGHEIPPKVEDEQAFILHWLVGVALRHGDKWKDVAAEQFGEMMAKAKTGVAG